MASLFFFQRPNYFLNLPCKPNAWKLLDMLLLTIMRCWTIVEHVYGIITLIMNSSFHKLFNCTMFDEARDG